MITRGSSAVAFDVMGTLFDLSGLDSRLQAIGAPPLALRAWFARLLHTAAALTLTGEFEPFPRVADSTLRSFLAQTGVDPERAADVLSGLSQLDAYPEAGRAVALLTAAGVRVIALTNGSEQNTRTLLDRAGLADRFERIVTTEEVRAYKPHPAPYHRAAEWLELPADHVTLIAAHAWDVAGARAAGLQGVWIDRLEKTWPLPVPQSATASDLVAAAGLVLDCRGGDA